MPELPEIVAHAERLGNAFAGRVLERFEALNPSALKTYRPCPGEAADLALSGCGHRGKFLLLRFGESGERMLNFVVHLMQGGRLRPDTAKSRKPRGAMARWVFADGPDLLLTEAGSERRAGVWLIDGDPSGVEPVSRLGPDADTIDLGDLTSRLASSSERIHGFLRDQSHLAGIGRLLANEILHTARISPFANTSKLDAEAVGRLHAAIGASFMRALAAERELQEMGRSQDRASQVHHRVGEPCHVCGDKIRSVEYRRYRVAYCPACQTGGKVLADNTTSRFLK